MATVGIDITVTQSESITQIYNTVYDIVSVADDGGGDVEITVNVGIGEQDFDINKSIAAGRRIYIDGTGVVSLDKLTHEIQTVVDEVTFTLTTPYVSPSGQGTMRIDTQSTDLNI